MKFQDNSKDSINGAASVQARWHGGVKSRGMLIKKEAKLIFVPVF